MAHRFTPYHDKIEPRAPRPNWTNGPIAIPIIRCHGEREIEVLLWVPLGSSEAELQAACDYALDLIFARIEAETYL